MKTKNIITFNPFTGRFRVNNSKVSTTLENMSSRFNFKKYRLYHVAYRMYSKYPWLYDMREGDELLSLHILRYAMMNADDRYRLTIDEMIKMVHEFPSFPRGLARAIDIPNQGIMVMENIIDKLSGFGCLKYNEQEGCKYKVDQFKSILPKLYYINYEPSKSSSDNWTNWLFLVVDITKNICKNYESNKTFIDNIMDREFEIAQNNLNQTSETK